MTLKKKLLVGSGGLMLSGFLVFIAGSLSWFTDYVSLNPDQIQGSTLGTYFAYGDGTKDKPYGINTPRHLYNLSWLQYMGEFNQTTDSSTGKLQSYYFEIDSSISELDMTSWTIPPIGTEEYPFIGTFNGNDVVVSNLTISNTFSDYNAHPYKYDSNSFTSPQIIGFFGIVGEYGNTISYDSSTNQVTNLYLDDFIVKNNSATNVLAGFLAGYVNGEIEYCGVHYAHFEFKNGTKNLADTDSNFDKVSKFTLIGAYNSNDYRLDGDPNGGGGQENDWGGSIDMQAINRRLDYITAVSTRSKNGFNYNYTNNTYNIDVRGISTEIYWNPSTGNYYTYYYNDGTVMPLNIDEEEAGLVDSDGNVTTKQEISVTNDGQSWHTTSLYQNGKAETILSSNNGYLVGCNDSNGDGTIRSRINPIDYGSSGGIYLSFGSSKASSMTTYDSKQPIELLTITPDHTTYRIQDDYNYNNISTGYGSYSKQTYAALGLSRYKKVIDNFNAHMRGAYNIHGFHFVGTSKNNGDYKTANVSIQGTDYSNYQLYKNALNFTLKDAGTITSLSAAYYNSSSNTLFNFYHILRENDNKISQVNKVSKIYKNTSGNAVYLYSDGTYSSSDTSSLTLVFDFDYLTTNKALIKNGAYYFEFPAVAGDYAISADSSNTYTAYLMYLDIGANASAEEDTRKEISKIDFVYKEDGIITKITDDNWDTIKSNVLFSIDGTETGDGKYYFRRIKDVGVLYYVGTPAMTVTYIGTGSYGTATDSNCESKSP